MNPLLSQLQPYPFERLRQLFAGVTLPAAYSPISLGMGEPRHPTPQFIKDALSNNLGGLASYPATAGEPKLREAFTQWIQQRYALTLDRAPRCCPSTARVRHCLHLRRPSSIPRKASRWSSAQSVLSNL